MNPYCFIKLTYLKLLMEDIETYFVDLLNQHRSVDIAESEFKKILAEDPNLRKRYSEWCHEVGSSERDGFRDFCEEYRDNQDSIWESLTDYDN